jgi:hypothetical protein
MAGQSSHRETGNVIFEGFVERKVGSMCMAGWKKQFIVLRAKSASLMIFVDKPHDETLMQGMIDTYVVQHKRKNGKAGTQPVDFTMLDFRRGEGLLTLRSKTQPTWELRACSADYAPGDAEGEDSLSPSSPTSGGELNSGSSKTLFALYLALIDHGAKEDPKRSGSISPVSSTFASGDYVRVRDTAPLYEQWLSKDGPGGDALRKALLGMRCKVTFWEAEDGCGYVVLDEEAADAAPLPQGAPARSKRHRFCCLSLQADLTDASVSDLLAMDGFDEESEMDASEDAPADPFPPPEGSI